MVADAGPQKLHRLPAPRLGVVVLILSLTLNAFVAGGFFYSQLGMGRRDAPALSQQAPEHPLEALVDRLGIDPETSAPFKEMRRGFRQAQQILVAKNRVLGAAYWEELATPQPDGKQLEALVDEMIGNRHIFQSAVTGVLVRFMATLAPEQRQQLLKIVEDKGNPLGAPVRNRVGN